MLFRLLLSGMELKIYQMMIQKFSTWFWKKRIDSAEGLN